MRVLGGQRPGGSVNKALYGIDRMLRSGAFDEAMAATNDVQARITGAITALQSALEEAGRLEQGVRMLQLIREKGDTHNLDDFVVDA